MVRDPEVAVCCMYMCCGWCMGCICILGMIYAWPKQASFWELVLIVMLSIMGCFCITFRLLLCCVNDRVQDEPELERAPDRGKQVWCPVVFGSVTEEAEPDFQLVRVKKSKSSRPVKKVLGKVSVKDSNPIIPQETCICCMEDFLSADVVARLPCGHIFHEKCIMHWFLIRDSSLCPMCRSQSASAAHNVDELTLEDIP